MTSNGHYDNRFDALDKEIGEIKDSLASAIIDLKNALMANKAAKEKETEVVKDLVLVIRELVNKVSTWTLVAQTVIPIRAVFWMFTIVILGLIGIEGMKQIGPIIKYLLGGG